MEFRVVAPDTTFVPSLATKTLASTSVKLRIAGSYLYVQSLNAFVAYNLQDPSITWSPVKQLNLSGMLCGKSHVILLNKPIIPLSQAASSLPTTLTLLCCNRTNIASPGNQESGLLQFNSALDGAIQVAAIDGGIIYRTQDRQIHTLMGANRHDTAEINVPVVTRIKLDFFRGVYRRSLSTGLCTAILLCWQ